ncbi:MAG: hypothetical protein JST80_13460 [Bdellovibrionales bacterium]|nr:hypothetical protein [Bdellovibrionales bacterium]
MKKTNWMTLGLVAVVTLVMSACGRGTNVSGRTYIASGASGYQSGYGYNQGYNTGYGNPYGYGMSGSGDRITFNDNSRATYTSSQMGNQAVAGSYYYTDSSNTQLSFRPDAQTGGYSMYTGEIRFQVSSDGNTLTNLSTNQVMYRQN